MSDIDSSENSTSTSDPPTPPPKRQKASTSTGKHKGARTHKVKEGEGKGKGKKRREPPPSSASSGSPKRQKASTSTGKHKGSPRTHKGKEGEGKGKGKKRREPSPSSASSGSDSNSPDHHHKSTKERVKEQKIRSKSSRKTEPSSHNGRSHLDIFQHHFNDLVLSITSCLSTVARKLYSKQMIPDEVLSMVSSRQGTEQDMATKLLLCMKRKIDLNPAVLLKFIDVLQEEPSCDEITKRITSESNIMWYIRNWVSAVSPPLTRSGLLLLMNNS